MPEKINPPVSFTVIFAVEARVFATVPEKINVFEPPTTAEMLFPEFKVKRLFSVCVPSVERRVTPLLKPTEPELRA